MQRANQLWYILVAVCAIMGLAYVWYTLMPATAKPDTAAWFTARQIEAGRAYSRALRIAFITSFAAQCGFLVWLACSQSGASLTRSFLQFTASHPLLRSVEIFLSIWLALQVIRLPFAVFSGYLWQRQWGFSTQTAAAWAADYLKSTGIELLLLGIGAGLLTIAFIYLPRFWWLAAAAGLSVWIIVASYLWPVVISPLFNQFTPANDPAVTQMVTSLADKAGLPVNEVLVMDASRRTTRANAYFAGVGETRRIVLYDTLLRDYPPDEVESVVAHELAHWRQGHITQGMLWGILGNFIGWGALFLVLRLTFPQSATLPPQAWAYILLFFYLISFISLPVQNVISQKMESEADAVAVALTGNAPAAIRLQVDLTVKNCSDIEPPAYVSLFSTHPSAMNRIRAITNSQR